MSTNIPGEDFPGPGPHPDEQPAAPPPPAEGPARQRDFVGTGVFWGLLVGLVLAVAVVILAAQNTRSATVSFLGFESSTPLIVLILVSLLAGVVLDEIVGVIYRSRRRRVLAEREELKRLRGS